MVDVSDVAVIDGTPVREAVLSDGQTQIRILSYGAITRDWRVAGRPMVLGLARVEDYPEHSPSMGIIAGRVANRISKARFTLAGQTHHLTANEGDNHLHGGVGLGRRHWRMEPDMAGNAVKLSYRSPEGEDGYPGTVDFSIVMSLCEGRMTYRMSAVTDRPTPINLAQHNYYNLAGQGDVFGHSLEIAATAMTPTGPDLIPTGDIVPVAGTGLDFRDERRIEAADPARAGFDTNLVLDPNRDADKPAVVLRDRQSGRMLRLWTDQPGLQLYTGSKLNVPVQGLDGLRYSAFGGVCLEPQHFPDAVNRPNFASVIVHPEESYKQRLIVEIT